MCAVPRLTVCIVSVYIKSTQIVFKNVVPTSQKTPCVFITNAVQLIQYSYIHAVYCDTCAEHTVCAEYRTS